jgi:GAF domain-containing protein
MTTTYNTDEVLLQFDIYNRETPDALPYQKADYLLSLILKSLESPYGYIFHVKTDEEGVYFEHLAITNLQWTSEQLTKYWQSYLQSKKRMILRQIHLLTGEILRKKDTVIYNNIEKELDRELLLPKYHPDINRFLSIPIFSETEPGTNSIIGSIAVANKGKKYCQKDVDFLKSLSKCIHKLLIEDKENYPK